MKIPVCARSHRPASHAVPIVDLFAGPGGLGEGFSSFRGSDEQRAFRIAVSVEKDETAHRTLSLRAMFRQFERPDHVPEIFYDYLRGRVASRADLEGHASMRDAAVAAADEARCATLGEEPIENVDRWISQAISGHDEWVLIGGPPCQAYSVAGRARRTNVERALFEQDHRHLLYREYLRIIEKFHPAIFVMENVKGILSARLGGQPIFPRILRDLTLEGRGLDHTYQIRSFVIPHQPQQAADFIIAAERYGLPQARHRVILLGVRNDFAHLPHEALDPEAYPSANVEGVLGELPALRSCLSRGRDSTRAWLETLREVPGLVGELPIAGARHLMHELHHAISLAAFRENIGAPFMPDSRCAGDASAPAPASASASASALARWLRDPRLQGWCNHESRGHMPGDLHRYLYAAAYARVTRSSPRVRDFPRALRPAHANIDQYSVPFQDRFRVQMGHLPSSTVVAHIAKDGHYYIHPDPAQARSLTVREAARLQTFPDNYFFEGNRTEQFTQVGNAVPPFLARQLAAVVQGLLQARRGEVLADAASGSAARSLHRRQ